MLPAYPIEEFVKRMSELPGSVLFIHYRPPLTGLLLCEIFAEFAAALTRVTAGRVTLLLAAPALPRTPSTSSGFSA
jgi:hypothetical protein